jgi:hypothetical protein
MVELVSFLFNKLNDELLGLMVSFFCSTWQRRNKLVFEEQFSSPLMILKKPLKSLRTFGCTM